MLSLCSLGLLPDLFEQYRGDNFLIEPRSFLKNINDQQNPTHRRPINVGKHSLNKIALDHTKIR